MFNSTFPLGMDFINGRCLLMLLHLDFDVEGSEEFILPRVNLNLIQAAIYSILPDDISAFLHDGGYEVDGRKMKLFAFGWPRSKYVPRFDARRIYFEPPVTISFSSPVFDTFDSFTTGVLKRDSVRIGNNILHCIRIEAIAQGVKGDEITVTTLSPITVYRSFMDSGDKPYTVYHHPSEAVFREQVHMNLLHKYRALYPNAEIPKGEVTIKPIGKPIERIARFRDDDTRPIKGWHGKFRLSGPKALLQMALDAGIGARNSSGWGCVELAK